MATLSVLIAITLFTVRGMDTFKSSIKSVSIFELPKNLSPEWELIFSSLKSLESLSAETKTVRLNRFNKGNSAGVAGTS
jgi:hypothetical protein